MTTHNQDPTVHESFEHQELVGFSDDEVSLMFRTPGDHIVWGEYKYADPELSRVGGVIVETESGNKYAMYDGLLMNQNRQHGIDLYDLSTRTRQTLPDIEIGQSWVIPGYVTTTRVKSVMLRYKSDPSRSMGITERFDRQSPWATVQRNAERIREAQQQRRAVLGGTALQG